MYFLMTDKSSFCIENINSVYDVTAHKRAHLKLKYLLCLLFYFTILTPGFCLIHDLMHVPHIWFVDALLAPLVAVEALFYQSFVGQTIL